MNRSMLSAVGNVVVLSLREIRANIMRSALTILGIVIGVAAVITMVTLGGGATSKVTSEISSLGRNMLILVPGNERKAGAVQASAPFTAADVQAIARDVAHVANVAPSASQPVLTVYGNENWPTTLTGTTSAFFSIREWPVTTGRAFDEAEEKGGKLVCVLGASVRDELFGLQDPIDATIRLGKVSCRVIGVLKAKGQSTFGSDQDNLVLLPITALQRRFTGNRDISMVYISAQTSALTETVQQDITLLLRQRRHVPKGQEDDFTVRDLKEITSMVQRTTGILTALLGSIAAISLLVGGIGIMNIMLVSVTERTREIGIRLAIGALERDVLMQFLIEAVMLSFLGGIIGVVLGLVCSVAGSQMLNLPFILNPGIVIVAVLFSGAVGVVFGYFPARRAARLNPIDALRHE